MRIPNADHAARPWRIHEITPDFHVEDVWAYRAPGAGPEDFPAMLAALRAEGGPDRGSLPVRFLFAARWKLGALLGWDDPEHRAARRGESLCGRLPDELRGEATGRTEEGIPFTVVYELPDECALEMSNRTVHGVCHLGWAPSDGGGYELRMAVLVKPEGRFGRLYMGAIKPFRYLVVYPALTRQWERAWRRRGGPDPLPHPKRT